MYRDDRYNKENRKYRDKTMENMDADTKIVTRSKDRIFEL